MMDWLPEWSTMPAPGGYRGVFRLFDGQPLRMVLDPKTGKPIIFGSISEALSAAKEVVRIKCNSHIRHETMEGQPAPADDPDLLAMEEWRKSKQEQYAASRAMVKNGKKHRQVVVERKVKRRGK